MDLRIKMLELLATYKFLTRSQFVNLGIDISRNHFTNLMKSLTEKSRSYVGQKKFGYHPKYGKVEDMYYLKPKGKKYLIEDHNWNAEDIHLPLGANLFRNDYHHRKETINIRIDIEQQARNNGYMVEFYDMYFTGRVVPGKKGRECSTTIDIGNDQTIKADSIFLLKSPEGKRTLYCLEYHNGHEVKRIVEQLKRYVRALAIGSPSLKYGVTLGSIVLNYFKNETTLNNVREVVNAHSYFGNTKGNFTFTKLY